MEKIKKKKKKLWNLLFVYRRRRVGGGEKGRERESGEICLKNETAKEKIYEEEERNKDEKRI